MATAEQVILRFGADASAVRAATEEISRNVSAMRENVVAAGAQLSLAIQGAFAAAGKLGEAISAPLARFAEFEKSATRLAPLVGSLDEAKSLMRDLRDEAANGTLSMEELAGIAGKLSAVFSDTADLKKWTTVFHDIAAGTGEDPSRLVAEFVKAKASGRVEGGFLDAFAKRGFNVFEPLAEATGKTGEELRKMAADGTLAFAAIERAILSLATGSGKFAGQAKALSSTFGGSVETMKAQWNTLLAEIGAPIADSISPMIASATNAIVSATPVVRWFADVVSTLKIHWIAAGAAAWKFSQRFGWTQALLRILAQLRAASARFAAGFVADSRSVAAAQRLGAAKLNALGGWDAYKEKLRSGNAGAAQYAYLTGMSLPAKAMEQNGSAAAARAGFSALMKNAARTAVSVRALSAAFSGGFVNALRTAGANLRTMGTLLAVAFPRCCAVARVAVNVLSAAMRTTVIFAVAEAIAFLIGKIITFGDAEKEAERREKEHANSLEDLAEAWNDVNDAESAAMQAKNDAEKIKEMRRELELLDATSEEYEELAGRVDEYAEASRRLREQKAAAVAEQERLNAQYEEQCRLAERARENYAKIAELERDDAKKREGKKFDSLSLDEQAQELERRLQETYDALRNAQGGSDAELELWKKRLELEEKIDAVAEKRRARDAALDAERERYEMEMAIMKAKIRGEEAMVEALERARDVAKEAKNLAEKGFDENEARKMAESAYDLRKTAESKEEPVAEAEPKKREDPAEAIGSGVVGTAQNAVGGGRSVAFGADAALAVAREQLYFLRVIAGKKTEITVPPTALA